MVVYGCLFFYFPAQTVWKKITPPFYTHKNPHPLVSLKVLGLDVEQMKNGNVAEVVVHASSTFPFSFCTSVKSGEVTVKSGDSDRDIFCFMTWRFTYLILT